jgi:hypothetical protein
VLHVPVETWIGHAAVGLRGAWGAVTRRAQPRGDSRPAVYTQAPRGGQAVASAQASGISDDTLGHENERRKAENDALGQAWSDAEECSRGVKLAHAARGAQGEAAETVSRQALPMGRAVFHTPRELERVFPRQWKHAERQLDTASQAEAKGERDKRQGRDPRGVSGVAGRAWRKTERLCDQAGNAQETGQQMGAALTWFAAPGRLYGRQPALAHLDEARQRRRGDCWSQGKCLLSEERTLRHVPRLRAPLPAAVSEPVWRNPLTRLWYVNDQRQQTQGAVCVRFRQLVVLEPVRCERLCPQWPQAYRPVEELLRHAVRARSACRMRQPWGAEASGAPSAGEPGPPRPQALVLEWSRRWRGQAQRAES